MSRTIIRRPEVIGRVGLKKSQIAVLVRRGEFPPPVQLGARAIGWYADEIDQWVTNRPRVGAAQQSAA